MEVKTKQIIGTIIVLVIVGVVTAQINKKLEHKNCSCNKTTQDEKTN